MLAAQYKESFEYHANALLNLFFAPNSRSFEKVSRPRQISKRFTAKMQSQQQGQGEVIIQQPRPLSYQNLTPKEMEQVKEMQKWEQIRQQRRRENGIADPGMEIVKFLRGG